MHIKTETETIDTADLRNPANPGIVALCEGSQKRSYKLPEYLLLKMAWEERLLGSGAS